MVHKLFIYIMHYLEKQLFQRIYRFKIIIIVYAMLKAINNFIKTLFYVIG